MTSSTTAATTATFENRGVALRSRRDALMADRSQGHPPFRGRMQAMPGTYCDEDPVTMLNDGHSRAWRTQLEPRQDVAFR
ncbi:hypothetical protein FNJ84_11110 [Paracoccus sp. M683]|uniref:hypothetical protein n=1 Tax=Paracoccus sp. M683 TaxID=2594268 RepID=UPI00117C4930|nr:hypothetical protein [Paracoccus sp. M683]TRW96627.1 hypothetical protein FNJ84_11110 [Paracoccus sp. M683]